MTESIEQRYCIKFCQKLGSNQSETIQKIQQAFGDEALSQTQVKEWFNPIKNGRISMESEARSGRPSTSRNEEVIEKVRQIVMEDRRLALRETVEEVGISIVNTHQKAKQSIKSTTWEILRRLRNAVRRKRPGMWTGKNWQLHHDNAAAHSTHVINGFLDKNNTALERQPPYSPDLASCDFWLFPKLKTTLKGMQFQSRKDTMEKTTA